MSHYVDHANLGAAFFERAALHPEKPLLFDKRDGEWKGQSYKAVAEKTRRLAAFLMA